MNEIFFFLALTASPYTIDTGDGVVTITSHTYITKVYAPTCTDAVIRTQDQVAPNYWLPYGETCITINSPTHLMELENIAEEL